MMCVCGSGELFDLCCSSPISTIDEVPWFRFAVEFRRDDGSRCALESIATLGPAKTGDGLESKRFSIGGGARVRYFPDGWGPAPPDLEFTREEAKRIHAAINAAIRKRASGGKTIVLPPGSAEKN